MSDTVNIRSTLKSRSGFTLPEVLVTFFLLAFLAGAISTTLSVGNASWLTNSVEVELQQDLRQAMYWLKHDIQQTGHASINSSIPMNSQRDAVTYPDPDDDPAFNWNSYYTIDFQKVTGTSNAVKTWDSDTTTYYRESDSSDPDYNTLTRTVGTATRLISENISQIQARRLYDSSDVVEIALQASKGTLEGAQGRTITLSLNFKVQLRN